MTATLRAYIRVLESFRLDGVPRNEALDYLEFDSDQYPDPKELDHALEIVYGKAASNDAQ